MKRMQLLAVSVLALGLGVAHANPFPADAEASYHLPALDSYAEQRARMGDGPDAWGVSKRGEESDSPFPVGVGFIADE